ncbi:MAG TPA: cohesin domain-containing protein [Bryobacteraceae bacterium]|nr:cohesin domain-containing protein [Bryobacteraceae bacterium]HPT25072.1 cohesin domain-containing protein [Bryobacteraceae bacterium]
MKRNSHSKALTWNRLAIATLILSLALPALLAGNRKGDKFLEQGRKVEALKKWDEALELYEKALQQDPMDAAYQMAVHRVRFQAGQMHVDRGQRLRNEGNLEPALEEFRRAFAIDPASSIAETEMRRTYQMIQREKNKKEGRAEPDPPDRGMTPSQSARKQAEERVASISAAPELKPLSRSVTNLKMANQPVKVLYETLGKLTGVNVLFDSEFTENNKRYSLDLTNSNLEQALDYVAVLSKTFWKPLSANAIFITNDNVTKRRDYEEHVTRVFYLQNVTSPQELQEAMTAMRTVTDVRKVFPFNSQSALIVRGTADQIALAEKVLMDIDKPKPEVVVDILVMEASRSQTRNWAMTLTSGGSPGLSFPVTPAEGSESLALNQLKTIRSSDWTVTLPGAQLTAILSRGYAKVLQAPQVRATDGQKASLKLGDRYPYATGSYQTGISSSAVSALVSTQFQFADVGVNVDLTPRIHGSNEVSMQIELEVSSIKERIKIGDLEQPVIGQRKVAHIIRVREGEATMIGGLMQGSERVTRSGVPGLMNLPVIGRWFSSETLETNDADLLVVLVPHIVRAPEISPDNLRGVATGTETIWKVNYDNPKAAPAADVKPAPATQSGPAARPEGLVQSPAAMAAPAPSGPEAQAPPAPAGEPQPSQPVPEIPGLAPGIPGLARPGGAAAAEPRVVLAPTTIQPVLNSMVSVNVNVETVEDLFSAPMKIAFDNKVLKLMDVKRGAFLAQDGQQVTFEKTIVDDPGGAVVSMQRVAGAGGVSGSGTLVTLVFSAVGRGSTSVTLAELTLRDGKLQPIAVTSKPVTVSVK